MIHGVVTLLKKQNGSDAHFHLVAKKEGNVK